MIHVSHRDLHVVSMDVHGVNWGPLFGHPGDHLGVILGQVSEVLRAPGVDSTTICGRCLVDQGIIQGPSRESPGASGRPPGALSGSAKNKSGKTNQGPSPGTEACVCCMTQIVAARKINKPEITIER